MIAANSILMRVTSGLAVATLLGAYAAVDADNRECPLITDLKRLKVEIASVAFVDEVAGIDGNSMKMNGQNKDRFRLAVVTLRIAKPPGEKLTLAAADLTLHYYHGENTEAAACEGLSVFSTSPDVDRPVKMPTHRGPGFVKQTTGTASTQASTLYVDALFAFVEPNINNMWIAVAQPAATTPFRTAGWNVAGR